MGVQGYCFGFEAISHCQPLSTMVKDLVHVAVVKAIVSHLNVLLCGKVM